MTINVANRGNPHPTPPHPVEECVPMGMLHSKSGAGLARRVRFTCSCDGCRKQLLSEGLCQEDDGRQRHQLHTCSWKPNVRCTHEDCKAWFLPEGFYQRHRGVGRRKNILLTIEECTSRQCSAAIGLCIQHSAQSKPGIQSWHVSKEIQLRLEDMGFPEKNHL